MSPENYEYYQSLNLLIVGVATLAIFIAVGILMFFIIDVPRIAYLVGYAIVLAIHLIPEYLFGYSSDKIALFGYLIFTGIIISVGLVHYIKERILSGIITTGVLFLGTGIGLFLIFASHGNHIIKMFTS